MLFNKVVTRNRHDGGVCDKVWDSSYDANERSCALQFLGFLAKACCQAPKNWYSDIDDHILVTGKVPLQNV